MSVLVPTGDLADGMVIWTLGSGGIRYTVEGIDAGTLTSTLTLSAPGWKTLSLEYANGSLWLADASEQKR